MDSKQLNFAQKHLRILSGLYGLLRPLDLMQPYRLEMGLKFANSGGKNLYEFWGDELTQSLNTQLGKSGSRVLVNLASNEYFRSLKAKSIDADIVTPVFKALALAHELAAMPPWSVAGVMQAVVGAGDAPLDEALRVEREAVHKVSTGKHQLEGMMAFLEKRKPDFSSDPE